MQHSQKTGRVEVGDRKGMDTNTNNQKTGHASKHKDKL
jgi:hypothetical protein